MHQSDPLLGNISGFDQIFMFCTWASVCTIKINIWPIFLVYSHLSSWALNYRSSKFLFLMCLSTNSFDGLTKNLVMTNSSTALLYRNHHDKTFMLNHVEFWIKFSWCSIYICLKHKCNAPWIRESFNSTTLLDKLFRSPSENYATRENTLYSNVVGLHHVLGIVIRVPVVWFRIN